VTRRAQQARWQIDEAEGVLTLARRLPVRFDLRVETSLPAMDARRLAHQVRQDMWRALRSLRGFQPAVRIERGGNALRVIAGGAVDGPLPRAWAEAAILGVLEDPRNRARWQGFAKAQSHV
jgi:hypothetical protein